MEAVVELVVWAVVAVPGMLLRWVLHRGQVPLEQLGTQDIGHNATYTALLLVSALLVQQLWWFACGY